MFKKGEKAVYGSHGVVTVRGFTQNSNGKDSYLLDVDETGATIQVIVEGADEAGLRPLLKKEEIEKVLNILQSEVEIRGSWNQQHWRECFEKMQLGDPKSLAEVVRDLNYNKTRERSYGEKKMITRAIYLLKDELSAVLAITQDEAETMILDRLS